MDLQKVLMRNSNLHEPPLVCFLSALNVFNRWGELIWRGENLTPNEETQGWDGTFRNKPLNPAVFAYYGIIEFVDGSREIVEGDITLVR